LPVKAKGKKATVTRSKRLERRVESILAAIDRLGMEPFITTEQHDMIHSEVTGELDRTLKGLSKKPNSKKRKPFELPQTGK
jgi:hypothetical protein